MVVWSAQFRLFWMLRLLRLDDTIGAEDSMPRSIRTRRPSDRKPMAADSDSVIPKSTGERSARTSNRDRKITLRDADGREIELPPEIVKLVTDALAKVAAGKKVTASVESNELTTQQAADLLGVSRPFVVKLLDDRKIPFRWVGTHRRVLRVDVMRYRDSMDAHRRSALDELTRQAQQLGMGY